MPSSQLINLGVDEGGKGGKEKQRKRKNEESRDNLHIYNAFIESSVVCTLP